MRWVLASDGTLVQEDREAVLSGPYNDGTVLVSTNVGGPDGPDSVSFSLDRDARVAWIGWLVKHTTLTDVEAMALYMTVRQQ